MVSLMPAYINPLYGCKDPEHTCHLAFVLHKHPTENVNLFIAYIILMEEEMPDCPQPCHCRQSQEEMTWFDRWISYICY